MSAILASVLTPPVLVVLIVTAIIFVGLWIVCIIWVNRDAKTREAPVLLWTVHRRRTRRRLGCLLLAASASQRGRLHRAGHEPRAHGAAALRLRQLPPLRRAGEERLHRLPQLPCPAAQRVQQLRTSARAQLADMPLLRAAAHASDTPALGLAQVLLASRRAAV